MQKGILTRLAIHEILYALKNDKADYDSILRKKVNTGNFSKSDVNMLQTVVFGSLRHSFQISNIIKRYALKKINEQVYLLLLSAITQLVFLNFQDYAVVNSTVELAKNKKFKTSSGFVNAILKRINKEKEVLRKNPINTDDLPVWFYDIIKNANKIKKESVCASITEKPDLHLVFKNKDFLTGLINKSGYTEIKTSEQSICLKDYKRIKDLPKYNEGIWWVQDYSAMLPIYLTNNLQNKKILDMCAAPGGKTFQILSQNNNLDIIEKNPNRAKILNENLHRLRFKKKIIIQNAEYISEKNKYDLILIDAPCSSIGTIRRNPEILFRKNQPNFSQYNKIQKKLLDKAIKLTKIDTEIIYMVCSFVKSETHDQIKKFLELNKNFSIKKFVKSNEENLIDKNGFIETHPTKLKSGVKIDGFFAAKLIRHA